MCAPSQRAFTATLATAQRLAPIALDDVLAGELTDRERPVSGSNKVLAQDLGRLGQLRVRRQARRQAH